MAETSGMKLPVYETEFRSQLIPMTGHGHSPTHYRVWVGTVRWSDADAPEVITTVLMQNGDTEDWDEAKRRKEVRWHVPPHILDADIPAVIAALQRLALPDHREAA